MGPISTSVIEMGLLFPVIGLHTIYACNGNFRLILVQFYYKNGFIKQKLIRLTNLQYMQNHLKIAQKLPKIAKNRLKLHVEILFDVTYYS